MRVRFWGTRGSIAKAGATTVRYGGNTSCVELRSDAGTVIVLDCGTGAHGLGQILVREPEAMRSGHILISHTHWDHIQGLPFFAPLFVPGNEWQIYGPQGLGPSLGEVLSGQMEYTYFPITPAEFRARVGYHDLVEGSFEIGDVRVTTHYLNHPGLALAYRIEADGACVVYATDHEPHLQRLAEGGEAPPGSEDEKHGRFLADADLVIHDTQYTAAEYPRHRGWGHSTMEYVVDLSRAAAVRNLAMFHHDPMRSDDALDEVVARACRRVHERGDPMQVFAAAEGRILEVPRRRGAVAVPRAAAHSSALARPLTDLCGAAVLIAAADDRVAGPLADAAASDGLRVLAASDTERALGLIREAQPSLVIAASALPGEGGAALCRQVRASGDYGAEVPVVLVAEDPVRELAAGAEAGVSDWLAPPFSTIYARTRIRAWCLRTPCRWRAAARPDDEDRRLRALAGLHLRKGEVEERFERYTRIAAALFGVPHALVNIVDDDHQWTKASCSIRREVPRDVSLCALAILGGEVLQIPDLLRSPHADNPLIHGEPRVRFYAGLPLAAPDGSRVGTLCLVDERPRELDEAHLGLLRDLGRLVERELASSE